MAAVKRALWDEEEVLAYYRMLSLHQMFELVGSQLSHSDVEALSFLLDEAYPLDQALWAAAEEPAPDGEEAADERGPAPERRLERLGRRARSQALDSGALHRPKSGVRLLFELERRGLCDESNFRNLLQLLRVITRHDLLPYVGQKRGRAGRRERETSYWNLASGTEWLCF